MELNHLKKELEIFMEEMKGSVDYADENSYRKEWDSTISELIIALLEQSAGMMRSIMRKSLVKNQACVMIETIAIIWIKYQHRERSKHGE